MCFWQWKIPLEKTITSCSSSIPLYFQIWFLKIKFSLIPYGQEENWNILNLNAYISSVPKRKIPTYVEDPKIERKRFHFLECHKMKWTVKPLHIKNYQVSQEHQCGSMLVQLHTFNCSLCSYFFSEKWWHATYCWWAHDLMAFREHQITSCYIMCVLFVPLLKKTPMDFLMRNVCPPWIFYNFSLFNLF